MRDISFKPPQWVNYSLSFNLFVCKTDLVRDPQRLTTRFTFDYFNGDKALKYGSWNIVGPFATIIIIK